MPQEDLPHETYNDLESNHLTRRQEIGYQIKDLVDKRENQVIEDMKERSNLNFFSFAFVGAALTLNPEAMQSCLALLGSVIVFINGGIFGWLAQWHQRKNNIKHYEELAEEIQIRFRLVLKAYYEVLQFHSIESVESYGHAVEEFHSWRENMTKSQRMAKKTPLNIGVAYFVLLFLGLLLVSIGVFFSSEGQGGWPI